MKKLMLFIFAVCCVTTLSAQIKLSSIYTDNMVIKQNAEVPIWGWANASENIPIIASWSPKDTIHTQADANGKWIAYIKTPKADYRAHTIRCGSVVIDNVMLGEVWLCSGQSNMQWSVNHAILNGEQEASNATYPNIRIYQVPLRGASTPQETMDATWKSCTPATMRNASAIGYFFSRYLHKELEVPVGIISSAWGGTPVEPWVPTEKFDEQMLKDCVTDTNMWRPNLPSQTYNQMINPFVPFTLSGVIWYQGESNRGWAGAYDKLMKALITGWREKFEQNLPFYFVQIAPFNYNNNKDILAAEIREAQEKTASTLENTGMVVVSDIVNNVNDIHPTNKQDVGTRLANYALAEVYGQPIKDYKSPTFKAITISNGKALISFNNPTSELNCKGDKIEGFKIAGSDGNYVEAEAKIIGIEVEVWSDKVKKPVAVRYCFDDTSFGNLFSAAGLPVAPFRSDRDFK